MILEAKNVDYFYKANKDRKILDQVSYGFDIGKMYAILGPSGSGKTTFLSLLAGLDTPVHGEILYNQEDILKKGLHHHRRENVSLIFQSYNLIDYLTPSENVMLGGPGNPEELLGAVGILADEPTGNLDEETAEEIIGLLKQSAHELHKCVIVVTHSKQLAKEADCVVEIKHGSVRTAGGVK